MTPVFGTARLASAAHGLLGPLAMILCVGLGMIGSLVTVGLFVEGHILSGLAAGLVTVGGGGGGLLAGVQSLRAGADWVLYLREPETANLVRAIEAQGQTIRWMVLAGWCGTLGSLALFVVHPY